MKQTITHFSSGGARHSRQAFSAMFLLLLGALMLIPGSARAEGESSDEVTFTYISSDPNGYDYEHADNLFDGNTDTKWCFIFPKETGANVIFEAEPLGKVLGYSITNGADSGSETGRNPKSWKLYGSNDLQKWTLIHEVTNDSKLQDQDKMTVDYEVASSGEGENYKYFKWHITEGYEIKHNSGQTEFTMQMSEFKLNLQPLVCTGHQIVKVEAKSPTCTEMGNQEYYKCSVCQKKFKDAEGIEEWTDFTFNLAALPHHIENQVCTDCGTSCFRYVTRDEDKKLQITGLVNGYSPESLKIPAQIDGVDVVSIADRAFSDCSITSVTFEEGLLYIGESAFSSNNLTSVALPASLLELGYYAFEYNSKLSSVSFADNSQLSCINSDAFGETQLVEINIPASVGQIDPGAFTSCSQLTTVTFNRLFLSADGARYSAYMFTDCDALETINVPKPCEATYKKMLENGGVSEKISGQEIDITANGLRFELNEEQKGLVCLGFSSGDTDANHNKVVEIPSEVSGCPVTSIGEMAFSGSDMKIIKIPASVATVAQNAFQGCNSLNMVFFYRDPSKKGQEDISGYPAALFDGCSKLAVCFVPENSREAYLAQLQKDYNDGIVCEMWEQVDDETYPEQLKIKLNEAQDGWICNRFYEKLTDFVVPVEAYGLPIVGIKNSAFVDADIKNVTVPENSKLQFINQYAFTGSKIRTITLKTYVPEISSGAFSDMSYLDYVLVNEEDYDKYKEKVGYDIYKFATAGTELNLTDAEGYSMVHPVLYQPGTVSYERTLPVSDEGTTGRYATLCLPFTLRLSLTQGIFEKVYVPMNTMIRHTEKSTPEQDYFILMLKKQSQGEYDYINAGQPFFVKLAEGVTDKFSLSNYTDETLSNDIYIRNESMTVVDWDGASGLMEENNQFHISYTGTLQPKEAQETDHLWTFNPDGTFGKQTEGTVHPFRLVLSVEKEAEASAQAKQCVISIGVTDGTTTGIREILSSKAITASDNPNGSSAYAVGTIYDLSGRKVATASTGSQDVKKLRKGIYVVNGKKMVVK